MIGELSRRIDIEWKISKNKGVNSADKIVVEIFAESRQVFIYFLFISFCESSGKL